MGVNASGFSSPSRNERVGDLLAVVVAERVLLLHVVLVFDAGLRGAAVVGDAARGGAIEGVVGAGVAGRGAT